MMSPVLPEVATAASSWAAAHAAREGGAEELATALRDARERTLVLLAAYAAALGPTLVVPYSTQLNPPLWEAGHVGWFQDYWIVRNRQRPLGIDCEPDHARPAGRLAGADALYDSSRVAHPSRWHLPLPDLEATRDYLAAGLAETLHLLGEAGEGAAALYFFRLALFHEDMHGEAATYMAQALDIPLPAELMPNERTLPDTDALILPGGAWRLGYEGSGFAFDNELAAHDVAVAPCEIDAVVVCWRRYLPFIEAGGYNDARWWSADGWQWREANAITAPRYLRCLDGEWQRCCGGEWLPLPLAAPAVHLSWFEADAWCRWAGRRLPSEAEWECAALTDSHLRWGDVWEWTASRFRPYPGFVAHPYRDYSAPWFDARYVLRGASGATSPRMAHPRYRNYFTPERNDVHAGFRSCAK